MAATQTLAELRGAWAACERLKLTMDVQEVVLFDDRQMGGESRLTLVAAAGFTGGFSVNAWDVTGVAHHGSGIPDMLAALDPAAYWDVLEDWSVPRVDEDDLHARLDAISLAPDEDGRIVAVVVRQCLEEEEGTQPVVRLYPERCSEEGAMYLFGGPGLHCAIRDLIKAKE
jgi:hypothetical protein